MNPSDILALAQLESEFGDTMVFITGDQLIGLTADDAIASGAKLLLEAGGTGALLVVGYYR